MYANNSVAANCAHRLALSSTTERRCAVFNKYPFDLTSFTFSPDLTSGSAKKRRPPIDPAQLIAVGEEADRHFPRLGTGATRPLSKEELQSLLQRKNVSSLPGVKRPRLYAVMCSRLHSERGWIQRTIFPVTRSTWLRLVEDAYLGKQVFYQPQERYDPGPVYKDTISASTLVGAP